MGIPARQDRTLGPHDGRLRTAEALCPADARPGIDVVVAGLSGYAVSYAGPGHVRLEPATAAVREFASQADHFTYRDIWFDATNWLPSRIVLASPDETLALDYVVVAGHWLASHVAYTAATRGNRHGEYTIDVRYDDFAFPAG